MPEALAARVSGVRRVGTGSARVMRAYRYARRWSVRTVTGAALAAAHAPASVVVSVEPARAEGRAPATSPIHPSQVPPPGMSLPGFHAPAVSDGTVSRGT
ncbi:TraB/GumN family protein, partial [Burkholderia cenocepacia]|nr:TraB/GumN family protein [Burkholderia cenocepacia]